MDIDEVERFYVRASHTDEYEDCVRLLNTFDLPAEGVKDHFDNFLVLISNNTGSVLGLIGLEKYGDIALIRSLVVEKGFHGLGLGEKLLIKLEEKSKSEGIKTLYLFTETAKSFFEKYNYQLVDEVDERIKESHEYRMCRDAVKMRKNLDTK